MRRVAGDFLHGSAHFVHRRGNHVGFTALLDDRAVGLFRNAGDSVGHFTELTRHAGHGLETVAELADHAVEGVAHRAHFVFGTDHHSAAQVLMGGHFLHGVTHGIDAADDHAADDVAHHQQSGEQQQQLDTGGNQDVAVYLAVQRGQVIGDAHRAHDRILRHLVAGKTVGAAVVLLGVDRVDHRQNAALFALGHLHDGLAGQGASIQQIGRGLVLETGAEDLADQIATHDASIDDARAGEDLVSQHLPLGHGAGQHHGVDAVEIGVRGVLGLLLDHLQHETLLGDGGIEQRSGEHQSEDYQQGQVDLGLDRYLPSRGSRGNAAVHRFP